MTVQHGVRQRIQVELRIVFVLHHFVIGRRQIVVFGHRFVVVHQVRMRMRSEVSILIHAQVVRHARSMRPVT